MSLESAATNIKHADRLTLTIEDAQAGYVRPRWRGLDSRSDDAVALHVARANFAPRVNQTRRLFDCRGYAFRSGNDDSGQKKSIPHQETAGEKFLTTAKKRRQRNQQPDLERA